MWTVIACITLAGSASTPSLALRPVVSIDLKSSGYTLIPEEDEAGQTTGFKLEKSGS